MVLGEKVEMTDTDTYYIGRCKDGHPDDFRFLVQRYQGALMGYLVGKLGNRDAAEEAAQESMVRAYFRIETLKKPDSFFAWLIGIGDRVAKEWQRKEQIRRQRDQAHPVQGQDPGCGSVADYVLEQAIAELPVKFRRVILLRYYSQMSCKQIADQLQQPLGTVTKTLSRAYELLRQTMTDHDFNTQSEVAG